MRFDAPHALWALLAVLAFGVWLARLLARRRDAMARFAEAGLIDRIVERLDARRRAARLRLRTVAMALIVVALAGPLWGFRWEEIRREGIDVIVALDTSRSMLTPDVAPNRLERAKLAVLDLAARLDGDRVGLVAFAGTAFLECPLTLDYAAFERTLRTLHAGIIPRGGTSLARAIDEALASFEAREGKHQALVLITDGEDHEGDVEAAAQRAKDAGVKVYTVGIGTAEGELVPAQGGGGPARAPYLKDRAGNVVKSRLDESTLETIARTTEGAYVRGVGPALGLDEVFRDHIAPMERRDVASRMERRWEQRFQLPLAAAIVLLLLEAGIGDVRARRHGRVGRFAARKSPAAALALCALALGGGSARAAADPAVEGYTAYEKRDYDGAVERWREALIDEPDSPLLRFNLGAALYRAAQFQEAAESFAKVASAARPEWTAKASYNLGNALYRTGEGTLASDKQATAQSWERSLVAYRAAMAADPSDLEPKMAHEIVAERLRELRGEIEREQQEQPQDPPQDPQDPQDQQPQDQQARDQAQSPQGQEGGGESQSSPQGEQGEPQDGAEEAGQPQERDPQSEGEDARDGEPQAAEGDREEAPPDSQQAGGTQQQEPGSASADADSRQPEEAAAEPPAEPQTGSEGEQEQVAGDASGGAAPQEGNSSAAPPGASAYAGDDAARDPSREAAYAVLDAVRREELGPEEIDRGRGATAVAEPMKDW
jgi:Ca-activated chloride channel family protein